MEIGNWGEREMIAFDLEINKAVMLVGSREFLPRNNLILPFLFFLQVENSGKDYRVIHHPFLVGRLGKRLLTYKG